MDDLISRTMVENLSVGINPLTGERVSPGDSCYSEEVQEALRIVLEHCSLESFGTQREREFREKKEQKEERAQFRAEHYPNQGKPWTHDEEERMIQLYREGYSTYQIADILKRSPGAIASHIKKNNIFPKRKNSNRTSHSRKKPNNTPFRKTSYSNNETNDTPLISAMYRTNRK